VKTLDLLLDWVDVSLRSKLRWCLYGPGGALVFGLLVIGIFIWFCTTL